MKPTKAQAETLQYLGLSGEIMPEASDLRRFLRSAKQELRDAESAFVAADFARSNALNKVTAAKMAINWNGAVPQDKQGTP